MKILNILKNEFFWVFLLLILGFFLRIWHIEDPIADWHSWRQADTAAVTRNFVKQGFNPFFPKYDDMSHVSELPITNPLGFRFVEFPVYNIAVYPLYLLFGIDDKYHRLVSVLFNLASVVLLYLIVKKYWGGLTAFFSAFIFTVLPFNVFFSRTALPEPTFVFFALGMIYFVSNWLEKKSNLFYALSFAGVAFLIKPWAFFFYIPLCYTAIREKKVIRFLIFSIVILVPFILWRLWILQQPEGIPASSWLMNGDNIRFRPSFWWWLISERIGGQILTVTGIVFFVLGLIIKPQNGNYFFHLWLLSTFLYFIVFATGNVRHNYYQFLFVPIASVFFAVGLLNLLKGRDIFLPRIFTILTALALLILTLFFGFKDVREFYKINNFPIVEAGRMVDKLAPKDAIVLAPYNGDTAFLYHTNRAGWAYVPSSIKDMIADYGINYYVSTTNDKTTAWVLRHFQSVEENPRFYIVDLTKLKKDFDDKLDPEPR